MTRFLVTGAAGQLGREVVEVATAAGHAVVSFARSSDPAAQLTDPRAVLAAVTSGRPDVIVHAGAWTAVDECESDPARAFAVNGAGTAHVVAAAEAVGAHVLYISTDYVFDGTKDGPYREDDEPRPLSVYGASKLAGEQALRPTDTLVRTSWVCGAHGPNIVRTILRLAEQHRELRFVRDQVGCPTFTADLAPVLLDLAAQRVAGTFHVTNQGAVSWHALAGEVLVAAGLDPARVVAVDTVDLPARAARRPANSVLENRALLELGWPPLRHHTEPLGELVARFGEPV